MLKFRRDHIQQHFNQAARTYDEAAVLQKRVAEDMDQRLDLVTLTPERILDLGAGTGFLSVKLQRRYPKASLLSLDLSPHMLQAARVRLGAQRPRWWQKPFQRRPLPGLLNADAHSLPLADHSVDLVMTNLMLQWCDDPDRVFAEIRRVLRPEGLFMFSSFGPDTLKELRQAWSNVDDREHVNTFIDMHDLGDALIRNGFGQPVMDTTHFTLTYDRPMGVLKDLKAIGATNATQGRAHGLTGKNRFQAMLKAYEGFRQTTDGQIPATFEVVQGHAWAAEEVIKGPHRDKSGHVEISLDEFARQTRN
ncbi:malonyl-ACP O-methyltransferase BioC [Thiomicrospira sp. WB1]|uniref:malonyl-ACP O-methyltransferase BioC n=1 Tax=Thiomicrospira sp. WB1 TaxID=1685380 RepID=UPI0007480876|nr:malonyl-ACP O-methyltransferase BioC [Thiomicrospira sp. WB1]KUJ72621.1 malonyl-[acyl-carrier protein] O-methyltransferase BioC [Thiomicrospira sp. WB1]